MAKLFKPDMVMAAGLLTGVFLIPWLLKVTNR